MTTEASELEGMVKNVYRKWQEGDREEINRCRQFFTAACDGRATPRIMDYLRSLDHEVN